MDETTVIRAKRGDREAFDVIARAVVDELYRVARLVLRDMDAAEDAVQETLVRPALALTKVHETVARPQWSTVPTWFGRGSGSFRSFSGRRSA